MNLLHVFQDRLDQAQGDTVTLPRGAVKKMVRVLRAMQEAQRAAGMAASSSPDEQSQGATLQKLTVQTLVEIQAEPRPWAMQNAVRDFSMQAIAERVQDLVNRIDPDVRVHARLISRMCAEELGLERRGRHPISRRETLLFEESELRALAERYGVAWPGEGASDEVQTDGG